MWTLIQVQVENGDMDGVAQAFLGALLNAFFSLWPVWLALGMLAVVAIMAGVAVRLVRRSRLARSGIDDIDGFGGKTFERYLEILFQRLGYAVERTKFTGDYGGDLVLRKDGIRTIVQAKRHSTSVGVRAVQEAVAAKGYYDCTAAMVVSNSWYTKQAVHSRVRTKLCFGIAIC